MRPAMVLGLSVLAICLSAITVVQAQPIPTGDLALVDFGIPTANTGNINTSTIFTIGDLTLIRGTGIFAALPAFTSFGPVTINTTIPNSITFGNSLFGNFTSTFITQSPTSPGFVDIDVLGVWTPGTVGGLTGEGPFQGSMRIAFTQTPPATGIISDTATFSTPPASNVVPEPSTIVMLLTGLLGALAMYRLRRRHCQLATA